MTDFLDLLKKKEAAVQKIDAKELAGKGIELYIQREDLLHHELSGNKWRKLKYNLLEAKAQGFTRLLSFGGAFSNHIYALAAAGKYFNFETIGIIRGEESSSDNSTLRFAKACGMRLHFVSRSDYRRKNEKDFINALKRQIGDCYLIPEGGSNQLAVKGCTEIIDSSNNAFTYDVICLGCGTGATTAGIIINLKGKKKIIAFSALKGEFLKSAIQNFVYDSFVSTIDRFTQDKFRQISYDNWTLNSDYHFGGYAKFNEDLIRFIEDFQQRFSIPLDPIYTGKMMYGIFDLVRKDHFPKGTKILAIHTGGLQGVEGFRERFGLL